MYDYSTYPFRHAPTPYPPVGEGGGVAQSSFQSDYCIRCPRLPLAVYREVVAHLRQVDGVNAGLLPQTFQEFRYAMSQVGGLWISYEPGVHAFAQQRVEDILAYYSNRFGAWEVIYTDEEE